MPSLFPFLPAFSKFFKFMHVKVSATFIVIRTLPWYKKIMKFVMFEKENKDKKYLSDPYRAFNFKTDEKGNLICSN